MHHRSYSIQQLTTGDLINRRITKMQVDDPPYLSVGTAVSAKYKGAFCEAKVSKVVRVVKCKVTYKMGLGNATVSDEQIKGTLRVGQLVQAKHPEKKEFVDATITKIQDCSQYTVVFDDGDITTLKRTALCLKSGRHFNESETLDQLPLTHPEHFGNPVVGGRRGRRNRQLKEDSSDGENEEEAEPDLEGYTVDIGKVISVEVTDKKRSKDNWFPGLVVIPSAQPTVRINVKDEFLVRSFKDGRYYTVPKKEVSEFSRELGDKVESAILLEAVQKALKYLDNSELPVHWERSSLFNSQSLDSDSDENITDSSDDEPCEEKDRFVAQLYKFMDDAGTPLNRTPTIGNKDIDLHRLFRVVHKLGGYNRVTNQNKWRSVTMRLHLTSNQNTHNQVKSIYKKCLLSFEAFNRTLGVTMLNHTRPNKKNRGRSLIRDKDRATPVNHSPKPEKEEEPLEKKEEVKEVTPVPPPETVVKPKRKIEQQKKEVEKKKNAEGSDTNSSDTTDPIESIAGPSKEPPSRPKRTEAKLAKEKRAKSVMGEKVKAIVEKFEEVIVKKEEEEKEKPQQTRSKSLTVKPKEVPVVTPPLVEKRPPKPSPVPIEPAISKPLVQKVKKPEEEKKRGRKRTITEEKTESPPEPAGPGINIGDKLKVYYGPTHESKVTYEAKVLEIDKDSSGPIFLVHYTGWNTRYDEWIVSGRIAENLSAATKAKRLKQGAAGLGGSKNGLPKNPTKRGRGMSITGRSTAPTPTMVTQNDTPPTRSTTPSSVTSSSSRTKSPATPATRSKSKRARRMSTQTNASNHSESDSDVSESETELMTRTRSGAKTDEPEIKTYKRKTKSQPINVKTEKTKERDDGDLEKTDDDSDKPIIKRIRKLKKSPEKSPGDSDDDTNPPKGRDFDLNQIRSELKGFNKALKVAAQEALDKEAASSSDDSTILPPEKSPEEIEEKKEMKPLEKSPSSEDIYEFKEPEPFEFEARSSKLEDKSTKKRLVPRIFDELEKSPPKKKVIKSPVKSEPEPVIVQETPDKKSRFRRAAPLRKLNEFDDEEVSPPVIKKEDDPFDKLVESPSFNIVKTSDKVEVPVVSKTVRNLLDEPLNLFRELPETVDDYDKDDMVLSDCESQTPNIFTQPSDLFSDPYSLRNEDKKDSFDDELIKKQIQRVILHGSSTDEDSNDLLSITPSSTSYLSKKREEIKKDEEKEIKIEPATMEPEVKKELEAAEIPFTVAKHISPALKETDTNLLETICAKPVVTPSKIEENLKEINIKTGSKIADSILQKFNSIKNKTECKPVKAEPKIVAAPVVITAAVATTSIEPEVEVPIVETVQPEEAPIPAPIAAPTSSMTVIVAAIEDMKTEKEEEEPVKVEEEVKKSFDTKPKVEPNPFSNFTENRKRRKAISRQFILESDSDSTDSGDSEQLVIVRSDEDSQTTSLDQKVDTKESDSNFSTQVQTTDESQPQEEEERNFKIEDIKKNEAPQPPVATIPSPQPPPPAPQLLQPPPSPPPPKPEPKLEPEEPPKPVEQVKEEEPDAQLNYLLCNEILPRSPAPATEGTVIVEPKQPTVTKSILEMPFASAPGSSNSKSILMEQHKNIMKVAHLQQPQQPAVVPMIVPVAPVERENRPSTDAAAVLDNTPPTTPDSSISNLSPRGDNDDVSPNTGDNESCKSNEVESDYSLQRRNSAIKVTPYSEEDTQMTGEPSNLMKKAPTPPIRKRRKSFRGPDEVPAKRGRKPLNRSRHNSDSDDTSEHSNTGSTNIGLYDRSQRSPRPSKYNFFVEFDPSLDSGQRIAVLQQKLSELRKTYADVKAELAAVERRRKKIKRREREAQKASKQEMVCA